MVSLRRLRDCVGWRRVRDAAPYEGCFRGAVSYGYGGFSMVKNGSRALKKTICYALLVVVFTGVSLIVYATDDVSGVELEVLANDVLLEQDDNDNDELDSGLGLEELFPLMSPPVSIAVLETEDKLLEAQEGEYRSQLDELEQQMRRYDDAIDGLSGQSSYLTAQRDSVRAQMDEYARHIRLLEGQLNNLPEETEENSEQLAEIRAEIGIQLDAYRRAMQTLSAQYGYFDNQLMSVPGQRSDYEQQLSSMEAQRIALANQVRSIADRRAIIADKIDKATKTAEYELQRVYFNTFLAIEGASLLASRLELLEMELRIESAKLALRVPETTQAAVDALELSYFALSEQLDAAKAQASLLERSLINMLDSKNVSIDFSTPVPVLEKPEHSLDELAAWLLARNTTIKEYDAQIATYEKLISDLERALGSNSSLYKLRKAELDYAVAQRAEYADGLEKHAANRYAAFYSSEQNYVTVMANHQALQLRLSVAEAYFKVGDISRYELLAERYSFAQAAYEADVAAVGKCLILAELSLMALGILVQ